MGNEEDGISSGSWVLGLSNLGDGERLGEEQVGLGEEQIIYSFFLRIPDAQECESVWPKMCIRWLP